MKKIYMVLAALMLTIIMTGCDSSSQQQLSTIAQADVVTADEEATITAQVETINSDEQVAEPVVLIADEDIVTTQATTPDEENTQSGKVHFASAKISRDNNSISISLNGEIEKSSKIKKVSSQSVENTLQGKLALQSYLFSEVTTHGKYDIYIINEGGEYIQWYDDLLIGETYTIIDEEFLEPYGMVLKVKKTFVMSNELNVISLSPEIQNFSFKVSFTLDEKVSSILLDDNDRKFVQDKSGYVSFFPVVGQMYTVLTESEKSYKISMDYSSVYNYLKNGELKLIPVGNIGWIHWEVNNFSYEEAIAGFILVYDESFSKEEYFSFTFDVDEDSFLYYVNSNGKSFHGQDNTNINIRSANGEYKQWDGGLIYMGAKVYVYFTNASDLDDYIYLKQFNLQDIIGETEEEEVVVDETDNDVSIEDLLEDLFGEVEEEVLLEEVNNKPQSDVVPK